MGKYMREIDSFLGPSSSMSNFKALEDGDYVDFIPDSWLMATPKQETNLRKKHLQTSTKGLQKDQTKKL